MQEQGMLLKDPKFLWVLCATLLVVFLEFLSLGGIQLPSLFAVPFFLLIILLIGNRTLYHGLQALFKLNLRSMNLLMLIATCGAFYLGKYEEAAVVIVLYTLAEKLEDYGIAKSRSALDALIAKIPRDALIKGHREPTPLSEIKVDDLLIIKPGTMIPLDGHVVLGTSSVDESTITGEPILQDKLPGDVVFAGTLNLLGYLEISVTALAQDSTLAKIKELTFQATRRKANTQRFIETFSSYYTPSVILLAIGLASIPPLFLNGNFQHWFLESLSLLVIACPCALVISTPISIYSAIGNASTKGVLIKGGKYLEAIGQIKAIALDKTRTLTKGEPHVSDVISFGNNSREDLLSCAAGIERYSEHPLSQSIVNAAENENYILHEVENFQNIIGKGVKADCLVCQDSHHCVGKLQFILEEHTVSEEVLKTVDRLQKEGKTVVVVSTHYEVEGIIALKDTLKPESKEAIDCLHRLGIKTIMLTGDHIIPAQVVATELGISDVRTDLLPQDKAKAIESLMQKYTHVAMVGDGINDAPALALSTVGISMSKLGSDMAIEASSIVILNDHLSLIAEMVTLGRRTRKIIQFNLFWAIAVKFLFITLALLGTSSLVMAIFADVGVTLIVILNSLRLMNSQTFN